MPTCIPMGCRRSLSLIATLPLLLLLLPCLIHGADPDPILDYCVAASGNTNLLFNGLPCKNPASVASSDFTSSLFKTKGSTSNPLGIGLGFAAGATFPALNTQGLSLVRIDYGPNGFVPPHVHPRASEVILVVEGSLLVGFVDTSGKYFSSTIGPGDLFIFPRGLIHFQLNMCNTTSLSFSSLNSQNPGLSLVASALFGSTPSIPDIVLEKTFSLTLEQVESIKKAFH